MEREYKELTDLQFRFAMEFMVDQNGVKAYERATDGRFDYHTNAISASRLLKNVDVKSAIRAMQFEKLDDNGRLAQKVVDELCLLGFSNIGNYLSQNNTILDVSAMDDELTAPIEAIKVTEHYFQGQLMKRTTQLKLYNKESALVELGKHLGIFNEDNNQKRPIIQVAVIKNSQ